MNTPQDSHNERTPHKECAAEDMVHSFPAVILLSSEEEKRELEMREVFAKGKVVVVGDLHGNVLSLKEHMYLAGVTSKEGTIIPPKGRTLVFLGDIVADRNQTGLSCLTSIHALRTGGYEVQVLAGNHDVWMIDYLYAEDISETLGLCLPFQGKGITELLHYHPKFAQIPLEVLTPYAQEFLVSGRQYIVEQVRQTRPPWFEELLQMKFFYMDKKAGTLFIHTPPTPHICRIVAACAKNETYTYTVKNALEQNYYTQMRDIFCYTNNRLGNISPETNDVMRLQRKDMLLLEEVGIKRIVVGHDSIEQYIDVTQILGHELLGNMRLYNVDSGSMKDPRFERYYPLRSLLAMDSEDKIVATKEQYSLCGFEGVVVV